MKNYKDHFTKIKSWMLLVTYTAFVIYILMNSAYLLDIINNSLRLLAPFFYALGIAYVLNIPMMKIESFILHRFSKFIFIKRNIRNISITITLIFSTLIGFIFLSFVIPQLVQSVGDVLFNLQTIGLNLASNINEILLFFKIDPSVLSLEPDTINEYISNLGIDVTSLIDTASKWIRDTGIGIIDYAVNFAGLITNWFVGLMLALYLLGSKESFIKQFKKLILALFSLKFSATLLSYAKKTNGIFKNFVGGQLVEALIIGILIYIMMLITGMPYAELISAIVAVMALVPVFGAMLAMSLGFILILSVDPIRAIWFVVLFQIIQLFENNLIYPKVVGESVGLPAIWTLLSIILFGGMFGITGMLTAVPLTASIYVIGSELINKTLANKKLNHDDDIMKLYSEDSK